MYDLHALRLPFWLESPQGEIVDAGFVPPGFQMRAGFTETTRFLDVVLPWADPKRYAGRWKLIVVHAGRVCRGKPSTKEHKEVGFTPRDCAESKQPVDYGYMIGVGSNFRLQAFLNGGPVHVGEPIRMTGMPTEAGLPVPGCKVTVDVVSPNGQKSGSTSSCSTTARTTTAARTMANTHVRSRTPPWRGPTTSPSEPPDSRAMARRCIAR